MLACGRLTAQDAEGLGVNEVPVADEPAPDLAVRAGREALVQAGYPAERIGLLVHAWTWHQGHDFWSPAHYVASRLGARKALPFGVQQMCNAFCEADLQVWLTPLYHGSMTGVMKNALDWLELTSRLGRPYLTGKVVALVSWANGSQAMQGINAMDAVAKALRAWVIPYTVPLVKSQIYTDAHRRDLSVEHTRKLDRLVTLLGNAAQAFTTTS